MGNSGINLIVKFYPVFLTSYITRRQNGGGGIGVGLRRVDGEAIQYYATVA
jgi:hypothetical protein